MVRQEYGLKSEAEKEEAVHWYTKIKLLPALTP